MTVEKLARFIVEDYYQGAVGDELFNCHVAQEINRMNEQLKLQESYQVDRLVWLASVYVEVTRDVHSQ